MPRAKTKSQPSWPALPNGPMPDVLTLTEAAAYLRLPEAEVMNLIREKGLPAQQAGSEWRLLLAGIRDWLRMGTARKSSKEAWMELAGVWRDDPHFQDLLREIDQGGSRPIAEDRA
jgi:excisionase family DNA binding protein